MMNKSAEYYEGVGDKLAGQGRLDEACRAYTHSMDDFCRPMDLPAYKRVMDKRLKVMSELEGRGGENAN